MHEKEASGQGGVSDDSASPWLRLKRLARTKSSGPAESDG